MRRTHVWGDIVINNHKELVVIQRNTQPKEWAEIVTSQEEEKVGQATLISKTIGTGEAWSRRKALNVSGQKFKCTRRRQMGEEKPRYKRTQKHLRSRQMYTKHATLKTGEEATGYGIRPHIKVIATITATYVILPNIGAVTALTWWSNAKITKQENPTERGTGTRTLFRKM